MIFIAHRGNLSGPEPDSENATAYIEAALRAGYDTEVDVWRVRGEFYLGHDSAQHGVSADFLQRDGLWCHAKNVEALESLLQIPRAHVFWHQTDDFTLTSEGYVWTYPGRTLIEGAICVLPESSSEEPALEHCGGICSDFVARYRAQLALPTAVVYTR